MLLLAVTGTKGGKLPNGLTKKLEQAAYFYAKKLKMSEEDTFIEIKVPRKRGFIDGCIGGLCSANDEEHDAGYEYMHIEIDLANIKFGDMLRNLAHEMVHAKQYVKRELCLDVQSWKGKPYVSKLGNDYDVNAPWEKEAYRRESLLYNKLLEHYGEKYVRSK